LADDNFTITGSDSDCPDSNNGAIRAVAKQTADYTFTLTVGSEVSTFEFTDTLEITALPPATYEIDITAVDAPEYNANFQLTIAALDVLQVATQLNDTAKTLTLNLSGGTIYFVDANGTVVSTTDDALTIDLIENVTAVRVTTDVECQGIFEQTFTLSELEVEEEEETQQDISVIYPNPFNEVISLSFPNSNDGDQIEIGIYTISGVQLSAQLYEVQNNAVTIDTGILADGIYLVRLKLGDSLRTFKLVKN